MSGDEALIVFNVLLLLLLLLLFLLLAVQLLDMPRYALDMPSIARAFHHFPNDIIAAFLFDLSETNCHSN